MIRIVDDYNIVTDFDDILPRNSGCVFSGNQLHDFHTCLHFDACNVAGIVSPDIGFSDFTSVLLLITSLSANSKVTFAKSLLSFFKNYYINTIICANAQIVTIINENYGCINRLDYSVAFVPNENMYYDFV